TPTPFAPTFAHAVLRSHSTHVPPCVAPPSPSRVAMLYSVSPPANLQGHPANSGPSIALVPAARTRYSQCLPRSTRRIDPLPPRAHTCCNAVDESSTAYRAPAKFARRGASAPPNNSRCLHKLLCHFAPHGLMRPSFLPTAYAGQGDASKKYPHTPSPCVSSSHRGLITNICANPI